jgi:hypothetical protein
LVDCDPSERGVEVAALRREVGQDLRLRGERGHGQPVSGRLGREEAPGGRDRTRERCAVHGLRAVDREHDRLLGAHVLRPIDPDGLAVLAQPGGL